MSAKEFYRKSRLNFPEMPPEIWATVLRHATWDFQLPSPSTYESIGTSSITWGEQLRSFRKVLITKRNIVRVSKTWHTLANPFLYEYILLGRNRVLAPLRDGLARAVLENSQVGWWTERLDVQMRDATNDSENVFATLAEILTYLPNLTILTFSITGHGFISSLPTIVLNSVASSSLKCVHWHNGVATPSPPNWTEFLQGHPEIESLDGKQVITLDAYIDLDAVKVVHGYPIRTARAAVWSTVDLPAVRSMFYDLTHGFVTDDALTFNRLGKSLRSIQLGFFQTDTENLRVPRFSLAFARIQAECTCLTQIVLAVRSWYMLGPYTVGVVAALPPTVCTLGIRVMDAQISEDDLKTCFNVLLPFLVRCNPALKTIKFMEARNYRAFLAHPVSLWQGLFIMEKLGVAMKDWADRLMVPPST